MDFGSAGNAQLGFCVPNVKGKLTQKRITLRIPSEKSCEQGR